MRSATLVLAIALVVVASVSANKDLGEKLKACIQKVVTDIKSKGKGLKADDVGGIVKTDLKDCTIPKEIKDKFAKFAESIKGGKAGDNFKDILGKLTKGATDIISKFGGGKDGEKGGKNMADMIQGFMKNLGGAKKGAN